MCQLQMSIMMATLILVVNYYQFEANAFGKVAFIPNFRNGKNVQELHKQVSNSKDENYTSIYRNGTHERSENIAQYINDEIENSVTKRHIRGPHNTATESILALNHNVKGNLEKRSSKSQIDSYPFSREYLSTNRAHHLPSPEYLPPSQEYLPLSREYLPPSREYLPLRREYLPPSREYLPSKRKYLPPPIHKNNDSTVPKIESEMMTMITSIEKDMNASSTSQQNNQSTVPKIESEMMTMITSIEKDSNASSTSQQNNQSTVPKIESEMMTMITSIEKDSNASSTSNKNNQSTVPEIESNSTTHQQTVVDVNHYHHIVYHHYHHIIPHIEHYHYDVPHIDYHHHDVPYIQDYHHEHNFHNCGEHNPTSTTVKPCSDSSHHIQHVLKHKVYSCPSFSYHPHYPSYSKFPAYPHYLPIENSYIL